MGWGAGQIQATEACQPTLEDRMKRCLKHLRINKDLVAAMDALVQQYGEHTLHEFGAHPLYARATIEKKRLKAEWKHLKKEAKKKK